MASITWADLIAASNLIVATTAAIIALLSPMIAWRLTRKGQRDDQKRSVKLNIFGILMENRPSAQTREVVRALNLIDVAFHDNINVRRLWREYHGMITKSSFVNSEVGFELVKQKMEELQTAMAIDLGFSVDRFDVERIYTPNWLVDEDNVRIAERQSKLNALRRPLLNFPEVDYHEPSSKKSINETYVVFYTGLNENSGYAFINISGGKILGSDMTGTRYVGTYNLTEDRLIGKVTLSIREGTTLVTGHEVREASDIEIDLNLPQNFADGSQHRINILGREITATFKKISL